MVKQVTLPRLKTYSQQDKICTAYILCMHVRTHEICFMAITVGILSCCDYYHLVAVSFADP